MMGGIAERLHRVRAADRLDVAPLVPARLRAAVGVVPQLSRYTLVSVIALALDFAIYLALTAWAMSPPLAGVIGYALGTGLHYLLSTRFVFDAGTTDKVHARLFGEFALTGVIGMGITAAVIALATGVVGLPALPAKVVAAGASFLVVFVLRRNVVFATFDIALPALPADIYVKVTWRMPWAPAPSRSRSCRGRPMQR